MIDIEAARQLLDFGARMGKGPRADQQLEGAVAIHNILSERGVAYLADEVGMGKTYVALGALAIFRHFDPAFRALVIAPRENIQSKWVKELRNFVAHNVQFPDLRVKAIDGRPARPTISCENLLHLVREVALNPNRDFFLRLTSFSLPLAGRDSVDANAASRLRDELREILPWIPDEVFDLRSKRAFKDNIARAICCALPVFDLVIVDEGHNLKHGFSESSSARNRVLGLSFGHPDGNAAKGLFPNYGPRAKRVLFLSATPIDETYVHLWNQLHVFGRHAAFADLKADMEEEQKKSVAGRFLIRRVTSIPVGGTGGPEHTKNLYRREWRRGGVMTHDEPIFITNARERLVVALMQKKVSELLGDERFKSSFQIGMLASFESFLVTAQVRRAEDDDSVFDDPDQADDTRERDGIDVAEVNRLARSYRETFDEELPHPKMDAVVRSLERSWRHGEKSLVFVRRVASVKELKKKLDERYDAWLLDRLRRELPQVVLPRFEKVVEKYKAEKRTSSADAGHEPSPRDDGDSFDRGGTETFFAWFFRGEGPKGIVSGANIQQRFIQRGATYATFFEQNHVADVLGVAPGNVEATLARVLEMDPERLRLELRERSKSFLSRRAKKHARADRFEAVQAAAIDLLREREGAHQAQARIAWRLRFESSRRLSPAQQAPDIGNWLDLKTFFTEIKSRPQLENRIWPRPRAEDPTLAFRERELRAQLLASTARLGHALIDLYVMTIRRLNSLDLRAQEAGADEKNEFDRIVEYLDLLEGQMNSPRPPREWGAFDELADLAEHFDLVLDVNAPDTRTASLAETSRVFGRLLGEQQPIGGMSGQVNQTLVHQFRMPGYPLVLVTTDLLQEGEDLHTFCSAVHHYGLSWTPSSMEQRIGRIDRVRSQTERRLLTTSAPLRGEEMLQVFFPHLEDTIERLQVDRVLDRMDAFLRLTHEGLGTLGKGERKLDAAKEYARGQRAAAPARDLQPLRTAFPVSASLCHGEVLQLAASPDLARRTTERFQALARGPLPDVTIEWEPDAPAGMLLGTVRLRERQQPFTLLLQSFGARPLVRCVSPVGLVGPDQTRFAIVESVMRHDARVGAILTSEERTYDLTVEGDVLLSADPDPATDAARIAGLLRRVCGQADSLEQSHLPGRDALLDSFREDLEKELGHDS